MRRAAFNAGLVPEEKSARLVFCLEPEAAVVRHLLLEGRQLPLHQSVLVVDSGGGTVDITSHLVINVEPLQFRSVEVPSGGMWGSKAVDVNFVAVARQLFRSLTGSDAHFQDFQVPCESLCHAARSNLFPAHAHTAYSA
jgi:hypothetical protein